jgi:tetratricopeptide (TPR) repeat protein
MAAEPSDPALDRLLAAAFSVRAKSQESAAPAAGEAPSFGARYRVVGEIGRGGVGVVFRGHDQELERDVAIKVLRPEHKEHEGLAARFVAEAKITGRLEHPGTVPVHEIGRTADGRPWFAMKLIQGQTLASLLAQRANPASDRARFVAIFEQVCQTVAHAHARGVIHRDLKPANVLVGAFAEVQVADWGLAKVLGAPPEETLVPGPHPASGTRSPSTQFQSQAGSVLGTLAYMPPEQARGELAKVDARADVFALGALLCEILTGKPPYVGEVGEVFEAARDAKLGDALARLDASGGDGDLVLLAKRCLSADLAARPLDAGEVAAAVARHRASLGERARAAELAAAAAEAKARGERRARRLTAALAATIVVALVAGGAGWRKVESDEKRRQAEAAVPIKEALKAAQVELGRAQTARDERPDDAEPWQRALIDAERARSAAESGRPAPELVSEVDALHAEVSRGLAEAKRLHGEKVRDKEMAERIGWITSRWNVEPWADIDREFAEAFRDYGADFATASDDAIIARLKASPRRVDLAEGVFGWIRVRWEAVGRRGSPPEFERYLRICQAVDDDPWRVRIRGALATLDFRESIRAIADEAEHADLEIHSTFFLGFMLFEAGFVERATQLFHDAFVTAPDEHMLALQIAQWSHAVDPPNWPEALVYATAAVAIHPGSTAGWHEVGLARDALGEGADARAAFRRALATTPTHLASRVALARAELRAGDAAAAARVVDEAPESLASEPELVRTRAELELVAGESSKAVERLAALADLQATSAPLTIAEVASFRLTLDLLYQADATARALSASEWALGRVTRMTDLQTEVALHEVHSALLVLLGRAGDALPEVDRLENLLKDRVQPEEIAARRALLTELAAAEKRFEELATGEWTPASPLEFARAAGVARRNGATALATSLWEQALAGDAASIDSLLVEQRDAVVDAAATALLAATHHGDDAANLNDAGVKRCSALARGWLARQLELDAAAGAPRGRLRDDVERWLRDPRLLAVRDPKGAAAFGGDEAAAWGTLFEKAREALKSAPAH